MKVGARLQSEGEDGGKHTPVKDDKMTLETAQGSVGSNCDAHLYVLLLLDVTDVNTYTEKSYHVSLSNTNIYRNMSVCIGDLDYQWIRHTVL